MDNCPHYQQPSFQFNILQDYHIRNGVFHFFFPTIYSPKQSNSTPISATDGSDTIFVYHVIQTHVGLHQTGTFEGPSSD